jgi:hypothetical protein
VCPDQAVTLTCDDRFGQSRVYKKSSPLPSRSTNHIVFREHLIHLPRNTNASGRTSPPARGLPLGVVVACEQNMRTGHCIEAATAKSPCICPNNVRRVGAVGAAGQRGFYRTCGRSDWHCPAKRKNRLVPDMLTRVGSVCVRGGTAGDRAGVSLIPEVVTRGINTREKGAGGRFMRRTTWRFVRHFRGQSLARNVSGLDSCFGAKALDRCPENRP